MNDPANHSSSHGTNEPKDVEGVVFTYHPALREPEARPVKARRSVSEVMLMLCKASEKQDHCDKGYVADALPAMMQVLKLDNDALALKAGIYPSYIKAYAEGTIAPRGGALTRLENVINPKHLPALHTALEGLAEGDVKRLKATYHDNPHRVKTVMALGEVTQDTHLHEFTEAVFRKHRWDTEGLSIKEVADVSRSFEKKAYHLTEDAIDNLFYKSRKKAQNPKPSLRNPEAYRISEAFARSMSRVLGDKEGIYVPLILDLAEKHKARKPFKDVFAAYMATKNPSFNGLFDFTAKEWGCPKQEVLEEFGMVSRMLFNDGTHSRNTLYYQQLGSEHGLDLKQIDDFVALRQDTFGLGTIESLTQNARDILNAEHPTYKDFKNNLIVVQMQEAMPSQKNRSDEDEIDKTLVPNALLGCLLRRSGTAPYVYFDAIEKTRQYAYDILAGERGFLMHRRGYRLPIDNADSALAAADYFTADPKTIEHLALAFLEIGEKRAPDELMTKVKAEQMSIGEMVSICRLQNFCERRTLARKVTNALKSKGEWLAALESDSTPISRTYAAPLADELYKGFPDSMTKADFIAGVQGLPLRIEVQPKGELVPPTSKTAQRDDPKFPAAPDSPSALDEGMEAPASSIIGPAQFKPKAGGYSAKANKPIGTRQR